ncbi:unnamed protein product, partial [Rotaria sp. Silwood2]
NASNCYDRRFFNSKKYYDIMKTVSFLGVSGEVNFSNRTVYRVGHLYYIIKNIQPLNKQINSIDYLPVLKWDVDSTEWLFYNNQSDDIIWPNLSKSVPKDYKLIKGNEIFISNKVLYLSQLESGVKDTLFPYSKLEKIFCEFEVM